MRASAGSLRRSLEDESIDDEDEDEFGYTTRKWLILNMNCL